jgi:hypothetical protein
MVSPTLLGPSPKSTPVPSLVQPSSTSQVVLTGIDTLHLTAGGMATPTEWLYNQSVIWNDYQSTYVYGEKHISIQLPDNTWWSLSPYCRKTYRFQLHNPEIGYIAIWNPDKWSSAVVGKQQILLHLNSKFLHQYKSNELERVIKSILAHFFTNVNDIEVLVSRGDLHTDITRFSMLSYEEISSSISRSRIRNHYSVNEQEVELTDQEKDFLYSPPGIYDKGGSICMEQLLDKCRRLYENQITIGSNQIIKSKEIQTAYFGSKQGDIWGKCYNKSREVVRKNDNDTPLLWLENGYNGEDTVVRVEFSMRRGFLKQLNNGNYVSLLGFVANIDIIWSYLTDKWLRFVEEVKDNNYTTSIPTAFWQLVVKSFEVCKEVVIRKKVYKAKLTQLWKQGIGCISQMIAYGMTTNEDSSFISSTISAINQVLQEQNDLGQYFERRQRLGIA